MVRYYWIGVSPDRSDLNRKVDVPELHSIVPILDPTILAWFSHGSDSSEEQVVRWLSHLTAWRMMLQDGVEVAEIWEYHSELSFPLDQTIDSDEIDSIHPDESLVLHLTNSSQCPLFPDFTGFRKRRKSVWIYQGDLPPGLGYRVSSRTVRELLREWDRPLYQWASRNPADILGTKCRWPPRVLWPGFGSNIDPSMDSSPSIYNQRFRNGWSRSDLTLIDDSWIRIYPCPVFDSVIKWLSWSPSEPVTLSDETHQCLKHINMWRSTLDSGKDGVVLDPNAHLRDNFNDHVDEIVSENSAAWIIHLGYNPGENTLWNYQWIKESIRLGDTDYYVKSISSEIRIGLGYWVSRRWIERTLFWWDRPWRYLGSITMSDILNPSNRSVYLINPLIVASELDPFAKSLPFLPELETSSSESSDHEHEIELPDFGDDDVEIVRM